MRYCTWLSHALCVPPGHRADPVAQPRSVRHRAYRMLVVRCLFSWCFLLGSYTGVQNGAPNPKTCFQSRSERPQNGVKNVQLDPPNGYKMIKMGSKLPKRGPESIFPRSGGASVAKVPSKKEAKLIKQRSKKQSKNLLFFEAGSGSIFSDFSRTFLPKWHQHGAKWVPKVISKPPLVKKNAVSLSYSKPNAFGRKSWVRGFQFRDPR